MADNLVVAKKEYTQQLIESITPSIYSGITSIYDACKEKDSPFKCFQKKLCDIPLWNQNIITAEHDRIVKESKLEWLDMLIEAIFICNIKILSSIKSTPSTINVKIPDSKTFIHECYIQVARLYYIQPKTIIQEAQKNIELIHKAIDKAILHVIPQKEVIETCLKEPEQEGEGEQKEEDSDSDSGSDSESDKEDTEGKEIDAKSDGSLSETEVANDVFMNPPEEPVKPVETESMDINLHGSHQEPDVSNEQNNDDLSLNETGDIDRSATPTPYREPANLGVTSGSDLKDSLNDKPQQDEYFFSDSSSDDGN
jgi:hypothetical protein